MELKILGSGSSGNCYLFQCTLFNIINMKIMHGLSIREDGKRERLYHIWEDMRSRCNNQNNKRYGDYGGRGITICNEWNSFQNFHKWAYENNYNNTLSIDRIDVNGSYEPSNCRWSTPKEQANNRRNNRMIEYNGLVKNFTQWSEHFSLPSHVLKNRLSRGWPLERAFHTKVKKWKNEVINN